MTRRTTRRRYVGAAAAIGLAAVAGCADGGPGDDGNGVDEEEVDRDEDAAGEQETVDHENQEGEVRFVRPEDGDTVSNPVEIELEVEGLELTPADEPQEPSDDEGAENGSGGSEAGDEGESEAGEGNGSENAGGGESGASDEDQPDESADRSREGYGHLHVFVNEECLEPAANIPFEDGYHHLGDGGTEIALELPSGEHDLCAQASDGAHLAYDITDEITIEVEDGNGTEGGTEVTEGGGDGSDGNETEDGGENESDGDG